MSKIIAVNDLKLKCGNSLFKECSITFRRNAILPDEIPYRLFVSMLIKPSFLWHKNNVICYCDGIVIIQNEISIVEEEDDYNEDPDIEDPFIDYNLVEKMDLEEEIEETYQKEKYSWINRFSKNENLIEAIKLEYDCDETYCKERIEQEYPGFMIIDHTTYFWKAKCPSLKAINVEKRLMMQVNGFKAKYGTYVRIVQLEKHQGVEYNNQEAIVIFNYLNKFEVIGLLSVVEQTVYGRQLECSNFGSEVLSN